MAVLQQDILQLLVEVVEDSLQRPIAIPHIVEVVAHLNHLLIPRHLAVHDVLRDAIQLLKVSILRITPPLHGVMKAVELVEKLLGNVSRHLVLTLSKILLAREQVSDERCHGYLFELRWRDNWTRDARCKGCTLFGLDSTADAHTRCAAGDLGLEFIPLLPLLLVDALQLSVVADFNPSLVEPVLDVLGVRVVEVLQHIEGILQVAQVGHSQSTHERFELTEILNSTLVLIQHIIESLRHNLLTLVLVPLLFKGLFNLMQTLEEDRRTAHGAPRLAALLGALQPLGHTPLAESVTTADGELRVGRVADGTLHGRWLVADPDGD